MRLNLILLRNMVLNQGCDSDVIRFCDVVAY